MALSRVCARDTVSAWTLQIRYGGSHGARDSACPRWSRSPCSSGRLDAIDFWIPAATWTRRPPQVKPAATATRPPPAETRAYRPSRGEVPETGRRPPPGSPARMDSSSATASASTPPRTPPTAGAAMSPAARGPVTLGPVSLPTAARVSPGVSRASLARTSCTIGRTAEHAAATAMWSFPRFQHGLRFSMTSTAPRVSAGMGVHHASHFRNTGHAAISSTVPTRARTVSVDRSAAVEAVSHALRFTRASMTRVSTKIHVKRAPPSAPD